MSGPRLLAASMVVAIVAAGCVSLPADDPLAAANTAETAAFASYLHDLSPLLTGLTNLTEHYRTSMAGPMGNVELDTWVIRPDLEEPLPLVLEVTPYYTGGEPATLGRVAHELIQRGYAVGVSSVRGTGNSGGCFSQGGHQEALDTAAVIEELAGQAWSNGRVGLIGVSYPGTTPQDVWVEAPPSLKAIVPISGISDLYKYNFVNGVPIVPQGPAFNTYYWVLEGPATFSATDLETVPGAIAGEACPQQLEVQEGGLSSGLDGNKDAYWQERDFLAELAAARAADATTERAAVWYIHGLQDWNVKPHMMEDWLDALWQEGVPMKVWLGQWPHAWPASSSLSDPCKEPGDACRADWWSQGLVAWFDQFLKGIDTGILDAPAVQVQDDDGQWRHEDRWPPTDVDTHTYYFDADGTLASDAPGDGTATYWLPPAGAELEAATGLTPADASLPLSKTFVSEPLEHDLHLAGQALLALNVTSSAARASLVVSLGERDPDGLDRYVNFGVISLNHADNLAQGSPNIAGQVLPIALRFFPQDDVIHAGHRLIITFAENTRGSPGPSLAPVHDAGSMSFDLTTASLMLPVDTTIAYEATQPYDSSA